MRRWMLCLTFALFLLIPALHARDAAPFPDFPARVLLVSPDLIDRAAAAFAADDTDGALQALGLFIYLNPAVGAGYAARGVVYAAAGETANAERDFRAALELGMTTPQGVAAVQRHLADLSLAQDDPAAALTALDAALDAAPDAALYAARARLYLAQDDAPRARTDLDAALDLTPDDPALRLLRAEVALGQGDSDAALADLTRALELSPDNADAYYQRAQLHLANDDDAAALRDLTQALNLRPLEGAWYLQRARVHLTLGNTADAASDYYGWARLIQQTPVDGLALISGQPTPVTLRAGVVFRLPFSGSAGQTLEASALRLPGADVNPLLIVLHPDGTPLVAGDDVLDGLDAVITGYVLPADGDYTLLVTYVGEASQGDLLVTFALQ